MSRQGAEDRCRTAVVAAGSIAIALALRGGGSRRHAPAVDRRGDRDDAAVTAPAAGRRGRRAAEVGVIPPSPPTEDRHPPSPASKGGGRKHRRSAAEEETKPDPAHRKIEHPGRADAGRAEEPVRPVAAAVRGYPIEVSAEAAAAHAAALVLDLHNDLLTKLTHSYYDFHRPHAPATFYNPLRLDLDLPRIDRGGIDALGCLMFAGFRVNRSLRFWRQLDCARRLVERHPDAVALARSADDIRAARAAGKLALFLGVEGSYAIDDDAARGGRGAAGRGGRALLGPLGSATAAPGRRAGPGRGRPRPDRARQAPGASLQRRRPVARRVARQQANLLGHRRDLANAAVLIALGSVGRAPAPTQPRRRRPAIRAKRAGPSGDLAAPYPGGTSAPEIAWPTTSSTSRGAAATIASRSAPTSTASWCCRAECATPPICRG